MSTICHKLFIVFEAHYLDTCLFVHHDTITSRVKNPATMSTHALILDALYHHSPRVSFKAVLAFFILVTMQSSLCFACRAVNPPLRKPYCSGSSHHRMRLPGSAGKLLAVRAAENRAVSLVLRINDLFFIPAAPDVAGK